METPFYVLGGILVLGFALTFYFLKKNNNKPPEDIDDRQNQALFMLQNQINEINKTVDTKLTESTKNMQIQFGQSAKIIKDVTEKLTELDSTNKQVIGFADQLQNLQDILQNPKQRGILGEYYLESVLKNVLPPASYQMQYNIGKDKTGSNLMVDAAIFINGKIIPIDAKFSLENYNRILQERNEEQRKQIEIKFKRDLQTRIDETSKYIRPDYNTMDFAFMFIPAEAIYYDLLVNQIGSVKVSTRDLIEYAFSQRKVIIVSPTSFFAYLQTVMQGLRALKIEESAKEIRKRVEQLSKHIITYDNYMQKLGNQIGTTVNTYNTAYKEFNKIDKDVMKISGNTEKGVEPIVLDRPKEV